MKRKLRLGACSLLGATAGVCSPQATAFATAGPYAGLEAGVNFLNGQTARATGDANGAPVESTLWAPGALGGFIGGYKFPFGLRLELELDYRYNTPRRLKVVGFRNTSTLTGDQQALTAFANAWYDFSLPGARWTRVHPYVGAGLGAAEIYTRRVRAFRHDTGERIDQDGSDTAFAWQLGTGVDYDLSRRWTVSAGYRFLQTGHRRDLLVTDDGSGAVHSKVYSRYRAHALLVSLAYTFGGEPAPPPPITTAEILTPPPTDSDHDGVTDAHDKCPNTPAGAKVDASGCVIENTLVLRAISFQFDSDELTAPARETLDEVAAALLGQPQLKVQIEGAADSTGPERYNLALSQRRAERARRYLVDHGVAPGNLRTIGLGESHPVADNLSAEGRARNRRVDFTVLSAPPDLSVQTPPSSQASQEAAQAGEPARAAREARSEHRRPRGRHRR